MHDKKIAAVAASLALLLASAAAPAQNAADAAPTTAEVAAVAPAHLQAVVGMLRGMHVEEITQAAIQGFVDSNRQTNPTAASIMSEALAREPRDFMLLQMAPVYARYFSQAEAASATRFFATPTGRKAVILILRGVPQLRQKYPTMPLFSPDEQQQLMQFERSAAGNKLLHNPPQLANDLKTVMTATGQRLARQAMTASLAPMKREVDGLMAEPGTAPQGQVPAADLPEGQNLLAQIGRIGAQSARQYRQAAAVHQQEVSALFRDDFLAPAKLVSADDLAASRTAVGLAGESLDRYLQACDRIRDDTSRQFAALAMSEVEREHTMQRYQAGQQRSMALMFRVSENQRALLSLYLQILDLMQANLGQVKLVDGKLVFANEADRQQLVGLGQQLKEAQDKERALHAEAVEMLKTATQAMGSAAP